MDGADRRDKECGAQLSKVKTTVQMIAIPFLLYDGRLFDVTRTCGAPG
jgi:hypothetical protein